MSPPYATLIPDTRAFLADLAQSNTRDWWQAHKQDYDSRLRDPARALLDDLAPRLGARSTKLFRPHRDVRFSKDKTPYHTHLHMMWSAGDGPAWLFGISPGYIRLGVGMMAFDKGTLTAWRAHVDAEGPALAADLAALTDRGYTLDPPELKRVPAPYDKGHPQGDLLRRKSLTVWRDLPADAPLPGALLDGFAELAGIRARLASLA